jgi:hypothetical protein
MTDIEGAGDLTRELNERAVEGTLSAGETGEADAAAQDAGLGDVIVGEIPDPHDLTRMLWTARCTVPSHGLLGTFEGREAAENARRQHLLVVHGRQFQ